MRAVIYCRVSSVEQTKNLSLPTQEKACRDYASRNGYTVDQVFVDAGESAKTTNRPEFLRLLSYCREHRGQLRAVIVYSLTRFSRNTADHHAITTLLRGMGISLRSVTEPIDESPSGRLMEGILAAMAQFDNDVRSERIKAGMRAGIERGRWVWRAPVGYVNDHSRQRPSLVPDPDRAPAVRHAFELCARGFTGRELLRRVHALGLRTRSGTKISLSRLYEMLRHPVYIGIIRAKRWHEEYRGDWEPLVSEDLFAQVQLQLSRPASNGSRAIAQHANHPDFPLRRFAKCGICGKSLTGSWSRSRNGTRHAYYHCQRGCTNVSKARIEQAFLDFCDRLSPDPDHWRCFIMTVRDLWRDEERRAREVEALTGRRITELQNKLTRLEEAYIFDRALDRESYLKHRDALREELTLARMEHSRAEIEAIDVEGILAFAEHTMMHASALWTAAADLDERLRLQWLLFPAGIIWHGTKGDGTTLTAQNCLEFFALADLTGEVRGLVDPTGLTWNHLADWLHHWAAARPAA